MEEPKKVLVVDDEEGIRAGIERILSKRGFEVHLAASGEQALEMLGRETFDVALIDLKMPGISGFDVIAYIDETLQNSTVAVIVSALATVEAAVEVTRRGAFDFLVKPFTPSDLMEVMDRAVKQRKLIREREAYRSDKNKIITEFAEKMREPLENLHEELSRIESEAGSLDPDTLKRITERCDQCVSGLLYMLQLEKNN
jgi:DNA-binding NtrC family response regulator